MIPVDSSTILRIVIFSAFVGFVLFCASYATQVWLKRNRGNRWVASWVFKVGMFLVICGLLGAGGSWVLNRFVDRSGIVDAGALFVVHARRDGHVVMTPRQEVGQSDIIAQYHPPALDDQLKVIDSQISEAQARIETHHVRPLEIDPVLLQRQEQVRAQISQKRQFAMDFARALRELDRAQLDANAWSERERTRTGDLAGPSTARYAVAGSGPRPAFATDFADEVFPSGTVTFLPGEASKLITIGVAGDTTVEETEAFTVTLTSLSDDTVVETATSEGLIRDDDSINDIVVVNTQTSEQLAIDPVFYDGPVVGVEKEIILISAENLNATVSGDNWFIRTGSGTDALAAHGGRNVLDGGGGSNFLTGASGEDTFFLDARGAIADIWSTVVGFGRGDSVTLWGVSAEHVAIVWADNLGAAGFTGLTLQATMEGQPNAMVTLVGYGRADLDSGILQLTSGSFGPSSPYLHIQLAP